MELIIVRNDPGPPKFECLCCGAVFYDGEHTAYERHVVRCGEEHFEEMQAHSFRAKAPGLFDPNVSGDVEFGKWVRRNRAAIWQGRVKM